MKDNKEYIFCDHNIVLNITRLNRFASIGISDEFLEPPYICQLYKYSFVSYQLIHLTE